VTHARAARFAIVAATVALTSIGGRFASAAPGRYAVVIILPEPGAGASP